MNALEYVFVRHGETSYNQKGLLQGQVDIPLNEVGCSQAAELRKALREVSFDAVYTSALVRTQQTAEIVTQGRGLPTYSDKRWNEFSYGIYEGKHRDEVDMDWLQQCILRPESDPRDGMETVEGLCRRVRAVLSEMTERHKTDTRILVVIHGGVMRSLVECIIDNQTGIPSKFNNCEYFTAYLDEETGKLVSSPS